MIKDVKILRQFNNLELEKEIKKELKNGWQLLQPIAFGLGGALIATLVKE